MGMCACRNWLYSIADGCNINKSLYKDGVHLNRDGNEIVARLVWEEAFDERLFVDIKVPAQVIAKRLFQNRRGVGLGHHHVVLETLLADVAQHPLQIGNSGHRAVAKGF